MVGMPFIADQPMNIKRLAEVGVAVGVDYVTVTKNDLKSAIIEVAENKKYKINIENLRTLLQDEPMTSLEKAIWWSEYVIRHKGTQHLRSPTADISWFNYLLVDVLLFVLFIVVSILLVIYMVIKIVISSLKFARFKTKIKQN
ncbi:hypothetical protein NQ314_001290 [Rhamnusium bicolor]|uniref:Glucuronosyltransferase n=1 Tax=Rhamnusium bicolor TaxID=1586634 RepID=A0AAV8ZSP0_9CUCU|nr:hypothetical protein NQ314_001290 [Rhamnusium bicolor]